MKIWRPSALKSRSSFVIGFVIGAILFSGSAYAISNYVSDNTATGGYLLCANKNSKAVTFPNKLSCPSGTIALDLGAVMGQEGPAGRNGSDGAQGPAGVPGAIGPQGPALNLPNYTITAGPQSVTASVATKATMVLLKKSGLTPGWYSVGGHVSGIYSNTTQQVIFCYVTVNNIATEVSSPNSEAGALWKGFDAAFSGMVRISSTADLLAVSCMFSGNAQVNLTELTLSGIQNVTQLNSD